MKTFVFIMTFTITCTTFASSNIRGTWIEEGRTLSLQIVDNPSEGPFIAGDLWNAMQSNEQKKAIKTKNFDFKCGGLRNNIGQPFGSCKIRLARETVINQGTELSFAISKEEAKSALAGFNRPIGSENIFIKSHDSTFMFEANWQQAIVAITIQKSLVTE